MLPLAILLSLASARAADAAVMATQFPPHTVRDLITICSAGKDDPMMVQAVAFCHGYAEAAVDVEMAHFRQKHGRKLFCLPTPLPPRAQVLASFTNWANADPARLDRPAIDGMFLYLAETYPCAKKK
jgi:hypothetical protein